MQNHCQEEEDERERKNYLTYRAHCHVMQNHPQNQGGAKNKRIYKWRELRTPDFMYKG